MSMTELKFEDVFKSNSVHEFGAYIKDDYLFVEKKRAEFDNLMSVSFKSVGMYWESLS